MLAYANGSRGHMEATQNTPSVSRLIQLSRATLRLGSTLQFSATAFSYSF